MSINFDERSPIYIQIMDFIKRDIVSKKLKGGDKLPSVREMAETLKVNPNTVQRAYQELEREDVTFTLRGMGTFITENQDKVNSLKKEMAKNVIVTFINGMKNLGFDSQDIINIVQDHIEKEEV